MKLFILTVAALFATTSSLFAQHDLVGHTFSNPNIMQKMINDAMKDVDKKIDSVRTEAIAKKEKEKGRKLNAAETKEIEEDIKKAKDQMAAAKNSVKMAVSMEFINDKEAVMRMKMSVDEAVLKQAGVSWAKRKAMKAGIALMPSSEKVKYTVSGNNIIIPDDKKPDTLRISDDGKYITGKMDEIQFKLTRTK